MMYTQKELILDSVKKLLDSKEEKWEPGKDMVKYAGPYFDSNEITAAVDSLLDGWLVMSYKCMKFEKLFVFFLWICGRVVRTKAHGRMVVGSNPASCFRW